MSEEKINVYINGNIPVSFKTEYSIEEEVIYKKIYIKIFVEKETDYMDLVELITPIQIKNEDFFIEIERTINGIKESIKTKGFNMSQYKVRSTIDGNYWFGFNYCTHSECAFKEIKENDETYIKTIAEQQVCELKNELKKLNNTIKLIENKEKSERRLKDIKKKREEEKRDMLEKIKKEKEEKEREERLEEELKEYKIHDFESLVGETIKEIKISKDKEKMVFYLESGEKVLFYHEQDCCESVWIAEIHGELDSLTDTPIIKAEKTRQEISNDEDSLIIHTFYKMATIKGYVTIRWYGGSNGYYGVSVDFINVSHLTEELIWGDWNDPDFWSSY